MMNREKLYITAISNLIKKINFLELNILLTEEQITEEEYEKELIENGSDYVIDISDNIDDEETFKEILNTLPKNLKLSTYEVGNMFGINYKKIIGLR